MEAIMKRQDIIKKKRQDKIKTQTFNMVKKVNVSALLFSSVVALDQVRATNQNDVTIVEAKHTPKQFLNLISGYAKDVAKNNGLYASVMMAQAAIESGWGNSQLASQHNNLFGIKGSYNGKSTTMKTLEDDGKGNYYQIKDGFKVYDNMKQSLEDYAAVITGDHNPNSWRAKHYKGALVKNTNSYKDATAWLTGRYATDTRYGSKLNHLIEQYGLTSYDSVTPGKQSNSETSKPKIGGQSKASHSVKVGESVWGISKKYGMTMDQLRELNNISGNYIYPGQVLKVVGSSPALTPEKAPVTHTSDKSKTSEKTKPITSQGNYKVQPGDSVWSISQKYGMTMSDLIQLNNIKHHYIFPGQILNVSNKADDKTPSTPTVSKKQPVESSNHQSSSNGVEKTGTHRVQSGESVWGISRKYGISMDWLRQLNNISGNYIYPGQVLEIGDHSQTQQTIDKTDLTETNQTEQTVSKPDYEASEQKDVAETNSNEVTDTPIRETESVRTTTTTNTYTIKAGDNLYRIALNHNISLNQLLSLNGFADSSVAIYPGQTIKVAQ